MHKNASDLKDELFYKYVNLVYKICNRINYYHDQKEDLIQVGLMGLHQATKKYNENMNTSFSTYATYYIVGEIRKEMRNNRMIKLSREMFKIIKEIKKHDKKYSLEELSQLLNVSKEKIFMALTYKDRVASLNKPNDDVELLGLIADKNRHLDREVLKDLDIRSQEILMMKYYKGYTQSEIADVLNISQSKISRLENLALAKLRKSQL